MSLDQFVSLVHEKGPNSQDAIATAFRKNKSLDMCNMTAISNACKALDPNMHPVGHGCVLYDPPLAHVQLAGEMMFLMRL